MKVNRKEIHKVLQKLNQIIDHRSSIPSLQCVRIEARDGSAVLTATDLSQTLSARIKAEGDLVACVPGKALVGTVKKGNDEVTLEMTDNHTLEVVRNGVTTKLHTVNPDDYPIATDRKWRHVGTVESAELATALEYVLPAACTDETRSHINSIYFDVAGRVVTTDGHRVHIADLYHGFGEAIEMKRAPAKTLSKLLKKTDSSVFYRSDDRLKITVGEWTLESPLSDDDFPTYRDVIPKIQNTENMITFHAKNLIESIGQLGAVSKDKKVGVKFKINGVVSLESSDPECGEAFVEIDTIENSHEGENKHEDEYLTIGVAQCYLLEALGKGAETATMYMAGPLDPIRVDLDNRTAVVMPMRLE